MTIAIFGANGKVGRLVVERALVRGYLVRAFVHKTNPFESSENLQVIKGDVHSREEVVEALKGADAVISALGSWGTLSKDILSKGMENIIPAMEDCSIKRIVSLTGNIAHDSSYKKTPLVRLARLAMSSVFGEVLRDADRHIELLHESNLSWTAVRSTVMNEVGSEKYELSNKPSLIGTVHRRAVAESILDLVSSEDFIRQSPYILRK